MAKQSLATRATKPMVLTKLMVVGGAPPRAPTPAEAGLAYEDVAFTATDGVELKGWFIPARRARGPGRPWCSCTAGCGTGWATSPAGCRSRTATSTSCPRPRRCTTPASTCCSSTCATTARATRAPPMTYGPLEARDYIGAVSYLRSRPDVDGERIGAIGTSMGGNIVIYGQRRSASRSRRCWRSSPRGCTDFNANFARDEMGPLGPALLKPIDWIYAAMRAPRPEQARPRRPGAPARRHRRPVRPGHRRPVGHDGDRRGVRRPSRRTRWPS